MDVYVGKLRQKLGEALPGRTLIHTHFGFGYRLSPSRRRVFTPFSQGARTAAITDSAAGRDESAPPMTEPKEKTR